MKNINTSFMLICFFAFACNNTNNDKALHSKMESLINENDSLKVLTNNNSVNDNDEIYTFLTFQDNNAESAMNFYVSLFENSEIVRIQRWEKGGPVEEGKIMHATFSLNGNMFMCSDSPPIHDWDFSPAVSNYINCKNEGEQEKLFSKLSENGEVTMPLNNYGFSKKFGWVIDQFGISWQLNLE